MKESAKLYRGDFSDPRKVILQSKCISKFYLSLSLLTPTCLIASLLQKFKFLAFYFLKYIYTWFELYSR